MRPFCVPALSLGLVLAVGCGSKNEAPQNNPADMKPAPTHGGRMTPDNTNRIVSEKMTLNDVNAMFAGVGEATNDEKPGLMPGSKYVWKEDNKKVYASFGADGKANGVAWEGFGGK